MTKTSRHQGVISRQSDESYSEDHWLKEFETKLQKTSVQPRGQSLYDQISSIMNTKSKYPSVQAAVDDMMQRSGLTDYLETVKTSEEDVSNKPKKTAQQKPDPNMPKVIQKNPQVLRTLENIIQRTRGNMNVPAIISQLHSLHAGDVPDNSDWEDEKLMRLVSNYNLKAKAANPGTYDSMDTLGQGDHSMNDSDIDASNTDAFNALMPAKI